MFESANLRHRIDKEAYKKEELDLTVPAVLTRLFRARNKLKEMYGVGTP